MTPSTLTELFFGAADRYAGRPAALRYKRDGAWHDVSFAALRTRVHHLYAALKDWQLQPGERVAMISENRPEWAVVDFACLAARLVDVPIYPTLTATQTAYILRDSGARGIFVSSISHLQKILEIRHELPALQYIVLFDGEPGVGDVTTLAALESRGHDAIDRHADWQADACSVTPDDLATLVYTSGTTGDPKGVMLSHGNITSNVLATLQAVVADEHDESLSFLPLSHMFERTAGHFLMLHAGVVINYATSFRDVPAEMMEVRPTILTSVPLLYEKIYARVIDAVSRGSGFKRAIFRWARATGERRISYLLDGRPVPAALALRYRLADALVFAKLRDRTGGRIRLFFSGGAPLSADICRFFIAAGIMIIEGYGLSETSPVMTANRLGRIRPGTVGQPIPGVELRIAPDGEILTRGPNLMKGYYHNPAATEAAIDHDGWFHTGDIGELDNENTLRITDRKKDLIKTAGGKYVAPQPIEGMIRTNPFFANAVMLGDRRNYPVMLLVPDFNAVNAWAATAGKAARNPHDLLAAPEVHEKLEREARQSLGDLAPYETPRKFLMLEHDFTIESGELTPTLKVKRKVVETHYATEIDRLYAGS